jgi:hypothetical protein
MQNRPVGIETLWVQLSMDRMREGELIGHVAEGSEKGKMAILVRQPQHAELCKAGEFCPVEVVERVGRRCIKAQLHDFRTEADEVIWSTKWLGDCQSFPGPLKDAKQQWGDRQSELRDKYNGERTALIDAFHGTYDVRHVVRHITRRDGEPINQDEIRNIYRTAYDMWCSTGGDVAITLLADGSADLTIS